MASYNSLSENSTLSIGKKILIPGKTQGKKITKQKTTKSTYTAKSYISYTVKTGDTLWAIARKYNVRVSTLASYNSLRNLNSLKIGTRLKIPTKDTGKVSSKPKITYLYYTIKKGDSLWKLSRKFNISVNTLTRINGLSQNNILRIGKRIKIPYKGSYYSSGISFAWPTRGKITSPFGWRVLFGKKQFHTGLDIANYRGTPIVASETGIVSYSGWIRGYGRVIIISHKYGYSTVYGHCDRVLVKKGERVIKRQIIAKMGNTGYSTGTHLHFEVRKNGKPLNPIQFLR